jgi:peptidoglycan L-alanyl-D-glutamate endopeptidase CwlK
MFKANVPARIRQMTAQLGSHWSNLRPEMQQSALAVIADLQEQGITVGVPSTGGWRSVEDQQAIDPANTNVVNPLDSYHVWGLAVDFVPIDAAGLFNWPDASDPVWQSIGRAIQKRGLSWGGNFSTIKDMPHGELHLQSLGALQVAYADPMDYVQGVA